MYALERPPRDALAEHAAHRGKIQIVPRCPIASYEDFAIWYTPGVAEACKAIAASRDRSFELTNRANTIAIVSDGTRVLGLGDIGPEAALPVMEGKSLLFKYLGGVDAVPLCVATHEASELVAFVQAIAPSFGGVNLEDIAQPKCFDVLERLRDTLEIPVWHDDQQGTAAVVIAALRNALAIVGKPIHHVRIALVGCGAANVATYRLLRRAGVDAGGIVVCDSKGTLHRGRTELATDRAMHRKWRICEETNALDVAGGIADAMTGADVCIAFTRSGPGVIDPAWVRRMAKDAIVFACANPVPEIWPEDAKRAGAAIVATGRSDMPNQLNNALAFPGIFRGVLDVRARAITDDMALAASDALAERAVHLGLLPNRILPPLDDGDLPVLEAVAVGRVAIEAGEAALCPSNSELAAKARKAITDARTAIAALGRACP